MDESKIEEMIGDLSDILADTPSELTEWEQGFIDSLEDQLDTKHFTESQIKKLKEIHMEKC